VKIEEVGTAVVYCEILRISKRAFRLKPAGI